MVFGKSIQLKNKEYWRTLCSFIFIFWNKIIVSHRWDSYQILCVFLFYLCLSWWLMFTWSPVEKLFEAMFKFLWTIVLNFWNRVLKIENQIFASSFSIHFCIIKTGLISAFLFGYTFLIMTHILVKSCSVSLRIHTFAWQVHFKIQVSCDTL